jgi:hypothetical protein
MSKFLDLAWKGWKALGNSSYFSDGRKLFHMAAMVKMPPKPHAEMKLGEPRTAKAPNAPQESAEVRRALESDGAQREPVVVAVRDGHMRGRFLCPKV